MDIQDIKDIKPSENYEGLKIQFNAIKKILESKEAEVAVYRKRVREFSLERIIHLESELESEKQMNEILTKELESLNSST